MALYLVDRDLSGVPQDRLRLDQRDLASVCMELKARGKHIRYISSAVVPADGRGLDLFGAENVELIKEAHAFVGVQYARIVEVLDLTPTFVHRERSRSRRSLQRSGGGAPHVEAAKGTVPAMSADASLDMTRWLTEGQRLFGLCLETLANSERLQARNQTLESENELLREEVARLRQRADILQADRAEMVAVLNDLAGHVTQVVDHILLKSENGEEAK